MISPDVRATRIEAAAVAPLKVLHVYTEHRSKGGAERFAELTMDLSRERGLGIESFTRNSEDLPRNLWGRAQAGLSAIHPRTGLRELAVAVDSFAPDLVHLYDYFPLISPWIAPFCEERGIPVVLHCVHYRLTCPIATHYTRGEVCTRCTGGREHWAVLRNCRDNLPESVTLALHSAITRKFQPLSRHISRFIAPCDFTRQWLARHAGVADTKIQTVMPFVDVPDFPVDPAGGQYVAFAGRFVGEKGIGTLLEAARISKLPVRLSRNQIFPVDVSLPPGVEQVVTRNRTELEEFYRGARMLVMPSEWFETFGLVGAEAMSHGVPVVASRIGALTDLVEDEVDGLLFEPGNAHDLARQMTRLWSDPSLCRTLGGAGRRKVLEYWTVEHYFGRLMEVYQEALAEA